MKTAFDKSNNYNPVQATRQMVNLYTNNGMNYHSYNNKGSIGNSSGRNSVRPISADRKDDSVLLFKKSIKVNPSNNRNNGNSAINNSNMNRLKSATNRVEPEKLYENCILLKSSLNNMNKELNYFRSEVHKKDSELKKQNKVIEEILTAESNTNNLVNNFTPGSKTLFKLRENNLISNLKAQYKEVKQNLKLKENELEELKRTTKLTRVKEVKIENETLIEEMSKMKNNYEKAMALNSAYENLQKEYYILQDNFTKQELTIFHLTEELKRITSNSNAAGNTIKEENEENFSSRSSQNGNIQVTNPSNSSPSNSKTFKDSQMNFFSQRNFSSELEVKNKRIKELEKELAKLKSGNVNPLIYKLETENKKLKEKVQNLEIKLTLGEINYSSTGNVGGTHNNNQNKAGILKSKSYKIVNTFNNKKSTSNSVDKIKTSQQLQIPNINPKQSSINNNSKPNTHRESNTENNQDKSINNNNNKNVSISIPENNNPDLKENTPLEENPNTTNNNPNKDQEQENINITDKNNVPETKSMRTKSIIIDRDEDNTDILEVEEDEDSQEVVLTMTQFNQKVDRILSKLADILVANRKTVREFFQNVITTHTISETESYEAIPLLEFVTYLRNANIQLFTIDIYCLHNKLKYSDEYEMVDVTKLVDEMLNYGIFEEHITTNGNITSTNQGGGDTNTNNNDKDKKEEKSEDYSVDLENIQDMEVEGLD